MHLYSHLVVAQALAAQIQPGDPAEYYWGAIAPDIRYAAGMRRRQTHRPIPEVRAWQEECPDLRDFALGYLVHVLADERDAAGALYDGLPFRPLRRRLPRPLAAVLLEAAYSERTRLEVTLSGRYNALLARLGVPETALSPFVSAAQRYADAPSLTLAFEMLAGLGLDGNPRLQRYLRLARWVEANPRLRRALLGRIDLAGVTRRIAVDLQNYLA